VLLELQEARQLLVQKTVKRSFFQEQGAARRCCWCCCGCWC